MKMLSACLNLLFPRSVSIILIWASFTDNKLVGFLQQGDISHDGIYQYLIKNQIDLSDTKDRIFSLSFGDFYGVKENGEYIWR